MRKKILLLIVILFSFNGKIFADTTGAIVQIHEGNKDAKIKIFAYESLTCSHCATFHKKVYPKLKIDFIDTGLAQIEFKHFPLDLAAFNASKIAQCKNDGKSNLLHFLYENQSNWVKGDTVEDANKNLQSLLEDSEFNIDFEKCTTDKNIEDFVLNDRIEGVKKFKVNATPTIIINDKKIEKSLNYKNLKKALEKLI